MNSIVIALAMVSIGFMLHQPKIQFLSRSQGMTFIQQDRDGYVRSLNRVNLAARGSTSTSNYLAKGLQAMDAFSNEERAHLSRVAASVDDAVMQHAEALKTDGVIAEDLARLPWIFAKVNGDSWENGFPHTRERVIFLSRVSIDDLPSLLLHEKIHVYQRMYPDRIRKALKAHHGLVPHARQSRWSHYRSNPDEDGHVYMDLKTGLLHGSFFASMSPKHLTDLDPQHPDHPYEAMAYRISALVR